MTKEEKKHGYFMRIPAFLSFRARGSKGRYYTSQNCRGSAFLGFDTKGRIVFTVKGQTYTNDIKIVISMASILEIVLFRLSLRQIQPRKNKASINKSLLKKAGVEPVNLQDVPAWQVVHDYEEVREELEACLGGMSVEGREKAEKQFQEFFQLEAKASILFKTEKARYFLEEEKRKQGEGKEPEKEEEKKKRQPLNISGFPALENINKVSGKWKV